MYATAGLAMLMIGWAHHMRNCGFRNADDMMDVSHEECVYDTTGLEIMMIP